MSSLVLSRFCRNIQHFDHACKRSIKVKSRVTSLRTDQHRHQSQIRVSAVHLVGRNLSLSAKTCQNANQETSSLEQWDQRLSVPTYVDSKLSYAYGRSSKQLKYSTLGPMIDAIVQREPHSTAVVVYDEGISKSFEQLNYDIDRLVNGMVHKLGLKRGDKVGIYSYNNYQYVLIHLACNKLGIGLNPMNPSYKTHELSYVLNKSEVKILFMPGKNSKQSQLNNHHAIICEQDFGTLQREGHFEHLKHIVVLDGELESSELTMTNIEVSKWRSVFSNKHEPNPTSKDIINNVESDDIYGVYYTSGTTGFPKGAAVTQFNVINNATLSIERVFRQRGTELDRLRPNVCVPLPLFHAFAGILGILVPFVDGGSIVLPGMRYNIQTVVDSVMRFKCNAIFLTPTILIDMLGYIEQKKISKVPLKTLLVAGSPVMSELVYKTRKVLPNLEDIRIGYGSSENGVIATIQTSEEPAETRPFTVGPPLDFTEIRIVNLNTNQPTAIGQSGEVQTRGFNTMVGYYKDATKTREAINSARWYKTGDLGILDKCGSLQIVGRIKDLIIKGGENIYPAEVETVLHRFEAIEDAHVFGVPDDRFGEEVCVWIKLKESYLSQSETQLKTDISNYCKNKLTYFKVPKYIIFVREFPTTPVKKIKKFEMRAQTIKLLNLE